MPKLDYLTVLNRLRETHGEKFDYSEFTEKDLINGAYSRIPVICNLCLRKWFPTINNHLNNRRGCSNCSKNLRYTLESFLKKANQVHGDKFDYSGVTEAHIKNVQSRITVRCKKCNYKAAPTIICHILRGCPNCSKRMRYTLEIFLKKAAWIHGDKFDYSEVREDHVKNAKSHTPIRCKKCNYRWAPTIMDHINGECGCPKCVGVYLSSPELYEYLDEIDEEILDENLELLDDDIEEK